MSPDAKTIERLRKLLALAQRGVGGEKDNAARMLAKMLAKHGMTIEQLTDTDEAPIHVSCAYSNADQRTIFVHIVASIMDTHVPQVYESKKRKTLHADLPPAQAAELRLLYAIHKRAQAAEAKKAKQAALRAYLHVNRLYPASDSPDDSNKTKLTPEEAAAIMKAMQGMSPTPVHKAIAA